MTTYAELRSALTCGKPGCECARGPNVHCPCPRHKHNDAKPSLTLHESGGTPLLQCRVSDSRDQEPLFEALKARGLWGGTGDDDPNWTPRGPAVASYQYLDGEGELLYTVCRTAEKEFPSWAPDSSKPHGRTWSLKGVQRVLFQLPLLLEAIDRGRQVFLVEGEKDVLRILEAGGVATCNPGGAGKWSQNYSGTLAGAHVSIVADNDAAGIAHAGAVRAHLLDVAASVLLLCPAAGKDAYDHLEAGYGLHEFRALGSVPEVEPVKRRTTAIGVDVGG